MSLADTDPEPIWSSRHPAIRARLLARLGTGPLAALTTRDPDDAAVALLDAWAAVLDVVAFYGDRIAAEAYLSTAREPRSVVELARMIGYELRPGLAATAALAFTVATQPGLPPVVAVPAGVRVQSTPGQDQQPQIYETLQDLEARPAWNGLAPSTAAAATVAESADELWLVSDAPPPRPGDTLLVTAEPGPRAYVARVTTVAAGGADEPTRVALQRALALGRARPLAEPPSSVPLDAPSAYVLRSPARLYGHDAPPVPDDLRPVAGGVHLLDVGAGTWVRLQDGLPGVAVTGVAVLTADPDPVFLVATAGRGVFRSFDGGTTWAAANQGITDPTILAVAADDQTLWAGGAGGVLWRSRDRGDRWERVGEHTLVERRVHLRQRDGTTGQQPGDYEPAPLPDAIGVTDNGLAPLAIHALAAAGGWLYVGNDEGVVASQDGGRTWSPTSVRSPVRALTVAGSELVGASTEPGTVLRIPLPPADAQPTTEVVGAMGSAPITGLAYVEGTDALSPATLVIGGGDTLLAGGADLPAVPLPAPGVGAVAAAGTGRLLVALAPGDPATADWPAFEPVPGQSWVDLDRLVADARTAAWLVLDDGGAMGAWPVAGSSTVTRRDVGPATPVTRLALADATGLERWLGPAVRRTDVLLASERVGLFPAPLAGSVVALADAGAGADLPAGRTVLVVGRRHPGGSGPTDERVGEQAVVAGTTAEGIILAEPLREAYHPGASTVYGNVVVASHGETVEREVLGSGDPGQANQTFVLARAPLTYLPAATSTGAREHAEDLRQRRGLDRGRVAPAGRSARPGLRHPPGRRRCHRRRVRRRPPRRPAAERHRERRGLVPPRAWGRPGRWRRTRSCCCRPARSGCSPVTNPLPATGRDAPGNSGRGPTPVPPPRPHHRTGRGRRGRRGLRSFVRRHRSHVGGGGLDPDGDGDARDGRRGRWSTGAGRKWPASRLSSPPSTAPATDGARCESTPTGRSA